MRKKKVHRVGERGAESRKLGRERRSDGGEKEKSQSMGSRERRSDGGVKEKSTEKEKR